MFVIRNNNGKYVNQPGSKNAFTPSIERARKFLSYESAKADCCGNEHPEDVNQLLGVR